MDDDDVMSNRCFDEALRLIKAGTLYHVRSTAEGVELYFRAFGREYVIGFDTDAKPVFFQRVGTHRRHERK